MSIETANQDGRYEIRHGPAPGARRRAAGAALGLLLCLSPLALLPETRPGSLPGLLGGQALLLLAALRLLAAASRAERVVASLHIATGEVEITRGRGWLARTAAFGAVEVDRFLLVRSGSAKRPVADLLLVPRSGVPVRVLVGVADEAAALDAGMVLSRGMDVVLDDRRWPGAPDPAGGRASPRRGSPGSRTARAASTPGTTRTASGPSPGSSPSAPAGRSRRRPPPSSASRTSSSCSRRRCSSGSGSSSPRTSSAVSSSGASPCGPTRCASSGSSAPFRSARA